MRRGPLRIVVTLGDEPLVGNSFVKSIVEAKHAQIVGLGIIRTKSLIPRVASGTKSSWGRSPFPGNLVGRFRYSIEQAKNLLVLVLIFGPTEMIRGGLTVTGFTVGKLLNRFMPTVPSPSIEDTARKFGICVLRTEDVNDPTFCARLVDLQPDIIINQAPGILGERFLNIPRIGVLNRHNALLPKNRGRLSPFWAVFKHELETGVTIHFVTRTLDAGPIVVQHRMAIEPEDTVKKVTERCYAMGRGAMVEAIEKIERGTYDLIPNPDVEATYNSNPTMRQAVLYRWNRMRRPWDRLAANCRTE